MPMKRTGSDSPWTVARIVSPSVTDSTSAFVTSFEADAGPAKRPSATHTVAMATAAALPRLTPSA